MEVRVRDSQSEEKTDTAEVVSIFTVSFVASGVTCCGKVPFNVKVILMSIFFDILLIEG